MDPNTRHEFSLLSTCGTAIFGRRQPGSERPHNRGAGATAPDASPTVIGRVAMKEGPKRGKLPGETYEVINVLAAILAVTSPKASSGEKRLMSKEFTRAFKILSDRFEKCYDKASPAMKKKMESSAVEVACALQEFAQAEGVCCVGCPRAMTREACAKCDPDADWACHRPEPLEK
jgi:hypothetical protein